MSLIGFRDRANQHVIGITADHAVAVGGASEHITIDADVCWVGAIGAEAGGLPNDVLNREGLRRGADLISWITVNFNQRLTCCIVIDGINGEVG